MMFAKNSKKIIIDIDDKELKRKKFLNTIYSNKTDLRDMSLYEFVDDLMIAANMCIDTVNSQ